jgi:hypothetical protein
MYFTIKYQIPHRRCRGEMLSAGSSSRVLGANQDIKQMVLIFQAAHSTCGRTHAEIVELGSVSLHQRSLLDIDTHLMAQHPMP